MIQRPRDGRLPKNVSATVTDGEGYHMSKTLPLSASDTFLDKPEHGGVQILDIVRVQNVNDDQEQPLPAKKSSAFWLVFAALCLSLFLSAFELTAVATALPTIAQDLQASNFVWVGAAYALASTAFLPMTGGLAQTFGRRWMILGSIIIFSVGSAICGAAKNMNMLIAARCVQGLGGGGIISLTSIILSDLVSLKERGKFQAVYGMVYALASAVAPVIAGALAEVDQWRWIFYLNLPLCAVSFLVVFILLDLPTPIGSFREKLGRMDWTGNAIVIASTCSLALALTWGGVQYSWSSAQTLVPLCLGFAGLGVFIWYEAKIAKEPIVPFFLMSNRTSLSGYVQSFVSSVIALGVAYYIPAFYEACKGTSPIMTGVFTLSLAFISPSAAIASTSVASTGRYRPQLWVGWVLVMIGLGLQTTIGASTPKGVSFAFSVIASLGLGVCYTVPVFPVLAPIPVSANAHALALYAYARAFAGIWGVTIGSTILQNELQHRLPKAFLSNLTGQVELAYQAIPEISLLPEALANEVRVAFADSLRFVWIALLGFAGVGFLASLAMKGLPLASKTDERWAMKENRTVNVTLEAGIEK